MLNNEKNSNNKVVNIKKNSEIRFKMQFRHLNYYSMPESTLIVFRKRLNFIGLMLAIYGFFFLTIF